MARTAKEMALEGSSPELRARAIEIGSQSRLPDDDPLWMVFLAACEMRSIPPAVHQALSHHLQQLKALKPEDSDPALAQIVSEMERINSRLDAIEQRQVLTQAAYHEIEPDRPSGLPTIGRVVAGIILGLSCFMLGQWKQSPSAPAQAVPAAGASDATVRLNITPEMMKQNQERLSRCRTDGNSKCTLLIRPES